MRTVASVVVAFTMAACSSSGDDADQAVCDAWETHRQQVLDGELSSQQIVDGVAEIVELADGDVSTEVRLSVDALGESVHSDPNEGYEAMQAACD